MNNTGANLKGAIASAGELKDSLQLAISDAQNGKLQVGAVVRLIVLAIAWLNQIAVTFGVFSVPNLDPSVIYIIATIITIVATLYSYWQNNSWTPNAKVADAVFDVLQNSGVSADELAEAIGSLIDSKKESENDQAVG